MHGGDTYIKHSRDPARANSRSYSEKAGGNEGSGRHGNFKDYRRLEPDPVPLLTDLRWVVLPPISLTRIPAHYKAILYSP